MFHHIGTNLATKLIKSGPIFSSKLTKMSSGGFQRIISNNAAAEELLASLKSELAAIKNEKINKMKRDLLDENGNLAKQVELAKQQLIKLEVLNGKKQVPLPNETAVKLLETSGGEQVMEQLPAKQQQPPKEKKLKKEKPAEPAAAPTEEPPIDIGRLDLRVGKIIEVSKHPDADALYLEKIDCGEDRPRIVISGLVKFVPIEEMQNRMVVILCNLKPAKMRGILSEAMVMCASTPEKVEVLSPPTGAVIGDLVHCDGYARNPDVQLNPKKKIFETVAPDLTTNAELAACYRGSPWTVPGKGFIVSQTLKNVNVK